MISEISELNKEHLKFLQPVRMISLLKDKTHFFLLSSCRIVQMPFHFS